MPGTSFRSTNPVKPEYRRNQYGGTLGGPVVKDRTFFFADYQRQRQSIARTVTSTVPTLLQRQGIFTEAIAGRVPVIYDPATTVGSIRSPFAGNAIPSNRIDPVALSLLQRYPLPTAAGTANNYSRTDDEIDNQDQWDARIDHKFGSNRDQVFGRLTYFRDGFVPVTPLPDGSGVTSGTLGPQDTTAWAFASNYQHTFSADVLNEIRIGDTRRTVGRTAAQLSTSAGAALSIPGHSVECPISEYAADVSHQRLPAARFASEHGVEFQHERLGGRRLADLAERPAHDQDGTRLALGTAQCDSAAIADRILRVQRDRQRLAGHVQHRYAARELPPRPGAELLDRSANV